MSRHNYGDVLRVSSQFVDHFSKKATGQFSLKITNFFRTKPYDFNHDYTKTIRYFAHETIYVQLNLGYLETKKTTRPT